MRSSMLLVLGALLALTFSAVAEEAPGEAEAEHPAQAEPAPAPETDAEGVVPEAPEAVAEAEAEAPPADMAGGMAEPAAGEEAPEGVADPMAAGDEVAASEGSDELPAAPAPSEEPTMAETAEAAPVPEAAPAPALGAVGYDEEGRQGRIHVVVNGDTLWDISDGYLGTPWIWPSIWKDNADIENPHLIYPGDRIWITPGEMRRVTAAEAEALLAGQPAAPEEMEIPEAEPMAPPDEVPVAGVPARPRTHPVSFRESVGLISAEEMDSAASIVGKVPDRVMLSQEDHVYIGLGEGAVSVGDHFTVFRANEKVRDPDTGRLLGHHVDLLGWVEVLETYEETSLVEIRSSRSEIEMGDKMIPREEPLVEIPLHPSPQDVDGKISFFPQSRVLMGQIDFVYLNRGALDGLEVGSPLEVYRGGHLAMEEVRGQRVRVPDRVVAEMLVVRARPESAVALVLHTEGELEIGDRFRGATD